MSQTSKVEAATVEDANAAGDGHAAGGGASAEAGTAQVDDRDARDSAAESTRPTDEAILSYENQIRCVPSRPPSWPLAAAWNEALARSARRLMGLA